MREKIELKDELTPPCLRVLGPEARFQALVLLSVPCDVLKQIGACKADDFCVKEGIRRPIVYQRAKLSSTLFDGLRRGGHESSQSE